MVLLLLLLTITTNTNAHVKGKVQPDCSVLLDTTDDEMLLRDLSSISVSLNVSMWSMSSSSSTNNDNNTSERLISEAIIVLPSPTLALGVPCNLR